MARIRTIKPEFWRHPVYAKLPDDYQLLALSLLTMADDEGYFRAEPELIRGDVQPFRENLPRISGGLTELVRVGWIELSEHPEQGRIGRIRNFQKHQRVHNPTPSKLKTYFSTENFPKISREPTEKIPLEQGTGNREQGKEHDCEISEIHQATSCVFLELGMAGDRQRMLIHDAVKAYMHVNNCNPQAAADGLIEAHRAYQASPGEFKVGKIKYFEQGVWREPIKGDKYAEFQRRILEESQK